MSEERDEDFLRRWSRLKQQARAPEPPAEAPEPALPAESGAAEDSKAADRPEEKPFDPADLPPVESLTKDSDYSLFMRREVPEDLRQKALRRLWATDSVLASPDLLDMHTLDYNAVPTFPEGVKSLFRIGQGMLDAFEAEGEKTAAEKAGLKNSGADDSPEQTPAVGDSGTALVTEQPQDAASQHEDAPKSSDSTQNKS